jgi:hypothetical protein
VVPKGKNIQPGFDPKRLGDKNYLNSYLDDLYKQAETAQTELAGVAENIAGATKGQAASRPGPKSRQRSLDKIATDYHNDPRRLTDLAGSKIIYRTLDDLYVGLQKTEKELGGKIVFFEDRFIKPMKSGYRDIQMNVRMSNGHIAEFRLHLESIEVLAEVEHGVYEVRRSIEPIAEAAGRPMTAAEKALNDALIETSRRAYAEALARGIKTP